MSTCGQINIVHQHNHNTHLIHFLSGFLGISKSSFGNLPEFAPLKLFCNPCEVQLIFKDLLQYLAHLGKAPYLWPFGLKPVFLSLKM